MFCLASVLYLSTYKQGYSFSLALRKCTWIEGQKQTTSFLVWCPAHWILTKHRKAKNHHLPQEKFRRDHVFSYHPKSLLRTKNCEVQDETGIPAPRGWRAPRLLCATPEMTVLFKYAHWFCIIGRCLGAFDFFGRVPCDVFFVSHY